MKRDVARTVAATAAVAALAAAVMITGGPRPATARAPIAPGLAIDRVERLRVEVGDRAIEIRFGLDGAAVVGPGAGAVDARAVRDLLSTLVAARGDQVRRRAIAAPRATITVDAGRRYQFTLGEEVAASGQVWLGLGDGRAALVPAWVGHALEREPDALRARAIVPVGAAAIGVELHGPALDLVLAGARLDRVDGGGARVRLAPARRAELLAALAELRLESFLAAVPPPTSAPARTVRVLTGGPAHELEVVGPCPGRADATAVTSSIGAGCVATAALDAVWAAGDAARGDDAIAAAPWPDGELAQVAVDGGATLARRGGGWELVLDGGRYDAEAAAVEALLAVLGAPARRRPRITADDRGARWTVTDGAGQVETWRVSGGAAPAIARDGEPIALALDAAIAIGPALRSRQLLRIDPAAITTITARGAAPGELVRGALLDEWRLANGEVAAVASRALPARLALIAAERWAPAAALGPVRRRLTISFDREPSIELAIGAGDRGGCWVAIDRDGAARLDAATCAALTAPL